jgi:hypothetical protein
LLTVSLLERQPETVRLIVPGGTGMNGAAQVLFENREVKITDGVIEDTFAPDDRHVYRFRR